MASGRWAWACVGWLLALAVCHGCGDDADGRVDAAAADSGDARDADAGPDPGLTRLVIGEHCPYPEDPGTVPPRISVRGGVEYWSLDGGCVSVTYQPELDASLVEHLEAAVAAVAAIDCSGLCLASPREQAFDAAQLDVDLVASLATLERRVHFMLDRRALPDAGLAEVYTHPESAQILGAFVFLPEHPARPIAAGDVLQLLGATLGLGSVAAGVDSVMSDLHPQPRVAPSAADQATLCRLYGEPPLCGER